MRKSGAATGGAGSRLRGTLLSFGAGRQGRTHLVARWRPSYAWRICAVLAALVVAGGLVSVAPAHAADHNVGTEAELRAKLHPTTGAQNGDTITFTADITLTDDLPAVQRNITIDGANHVLSGNNTYRGLFIAKWAPGTATFQAVSVTIRNLTIASAKAKGGDAAPFGMGGGGGGLGGALFVADQASVTLDSVSLHDPDGAGALTANSAVGGAGALVGGITDSRGGGGLGGSSVPTGTTRAGGGGLGIAATGASRDRAGGVGSIALDAAGAGSGLGGCPCSTGGPNGGGGGGAHDESGGGSGGGGVNGSSGSLSNGGSGGVGGFGGGGGGGYDRGGAGGFGGGGGAGLTRGGGGGFGGGGGGGNNPLLWGAGGFGGGNGAGDTSTQSPGGGGGGGMGGAIFVMQGGGLTVAGPLTVNGNTVTAGARGAAQAQHGSAFGSGIFGQGTGTLTFSPGSGQTATVDDVIADQAGHGSTGSYALTKSGSGTLVLGGTNTYRGATSVDAGTLLINGSTSSGSPVTVASGATLGGTGSVNGTTTVNGTLAPGTSPGTLTLGSNTTLGSGSTLAVDLNTASLFDSIAMPGKALTLTDNPTLSVSVGAGIPAGTAFPIITGASGITGAFKTPGGTVLSEGTTFTAGGVTFGISYVGGSGGHDVVLRVANPLTVFLNNFARNATATSTSPTLFEGEEPDKAVDGNTNTRWTAYSPSGATAVKTLKIDLGSSQPIRGFIVSHSGAGGLPVMLNTRDFNVEVSTDDSTYTQIVDVANNDASVTTHDLDEAVSARYVKLNITWATNIPECTEPGPPPGPPGCSSDANTRNGVANIYEVEVLGGRGSGTVTSTSPDTAINCPTTCTSSYLGNVSLTATPAANSTFSTWSGCTSTSGSTCTVNMTQARTVTAVFIAVAPGAVTLIDPAGTGVSTTPTYIWEPTTGATDYHLWVNGPSGHAFDTIYSAAQAGCDTATTCSVNPSNTLLAGHSNFWVRALNNGSGGPWSGPSNFTVGTPLDSATLLGPSGAGASDRPFFFWSAVGDATSYHLWVNRGGTNVINATYSSAEASCAGPSTCGVPSPTTLVDGAYRWWIRPSSPSAYGPWSASKTFTVGTPPATAPTLNTPSGSGASTTPTYNWNEVSGATSYQLWVNAGSSMVINEILPTCASSTCTFDSTMSLSAGSHTWWVRAGNAAGSGPWSAAKAFTVGTPPATPTLVSPTGTTSDTTPDFTWNAVAGATSYQLWVNEGSTMRINEVVTPLCDTTCVVTSPATLHYGRHTWWVRARNASGYGSWSVATPFSVS